MTKSKINCAELEGNFPYRKIIPQFHSIYQWDKLSPSAPASSLSQRKSWSAPPGFTASLTNCLWQLHSWEWGNAAAEPRFRPRGCKQQAKQHTLCKRLPRKSTCAVLSAASTSLPRHESCLQGTWCLQQKSLRALRSLLKQLFVVCSLPNAAPHSLTVHIHHTRPCRALSCNYPITPNTLKN